MKRLGLGPKELAHLLGVSTKTVLRGYSPTSTSGILAKVLEAKLDDARSSQSVRALAIMSARGGGLEALLNQMVESYVTMDLLRLK